MLRVVVAGAAGVTMSNEAARGLLDDLDVPELDLGGDFGLDPSDGFDADAGSGSVGVLGGSLRDPADNLLGRRVDDVELGACPSDLLTAYEQLGLH